MKAISNLYRLLVLLHTNWISAVGAAITTLAFLGMVSTYVLIATGWWSGPYIGLTTFLVLPICFVGGLVLMPVGLFIYRSELKERLAKLSDKPLNLLRSVIVLTLINAVTLGTGGYEAVHYVDSNEFCGTLCHGVMNPTYIAHQDSAHARVRCVDCHIGEGASWFAKSKISGLRQVYAVLFGTYSKPIPVPVHDLRPARETCEQCHWPDKFTGDRLVVRQHYTEDKEVTPFTNVLVMKTGGTRPDGTASGIHWHIHAGSKVTYIHTDEKRMKIPWVKLTDAKGNERIFASEDVDPKNPPKGNLRTMDCLDCHNQPSHGFPEADLAIDKAIASGFISRELPFIKKVGLEALRKDWTEENVAAGIRKQLETFYSSYGKTQTKDKSTGSADGNTQAKDKDPEGSNGNGQAKNEIVDASNGHDLVKEKSAELDQAIASLVKIWKRSVHPSMRITWGTYPSMAGHKGCMRCHDDEHEDAEGEVIAMDCDTCHVLLAQQAKNPQILQSLGLREKD